MMSGIFDFVVILHMILQYFTKIDPVELFTLHHVVSLVWASHGGLESIRVEQPDTKPEMNHCMSLFEPKQHREPQKA
jgi:hypothetical protein